MEKSIVILLPLMWLHLGFIWASVIIYWVLKLLDSCFHLLSPLFEHSTNYEFPIQILFNKVPFKSGKIHRVFSIWPHSQKTQNESQTHEDGAKLTIPYENFPLLTFFTASGRNNFTGPNNRGRYRSYGGNHNWVSQLPCRLRG